MAERLALTPGLDFYNEYVWTARGGTQEVKHTYTTTYDEVYNTTSGSRSIVNVQLQRQADAAGGVTSLDLKFAYTHTDKYATKYELQHDRARRRSTSPPRSTASRATRRCATRRTTTRTS